MSGGVEWQKQHEAKPSAVFRTSQVNSTLIVLHSED